ncbi:MAG TPA: hypothetical protein PLH94_08410 [Fimbriimonadaceae bacterium]|nr:hypothetical protein [Fimbriimonadaceae bacterium]
MPRPIALGNGSLLVNLDACGTIRDLFHPQVGYPNHLSGHRIRLGVWVHGRFAWDDDPTWQRHQAYRPDTLVAESTWTHDRLGLLLHLQEVVLPDQPVFLRRVRMTWHGENATEVRLFQSQDLRIAESDIGDTAFYNPFLDGIVHYKGRHTFLFGGATRRGGLQSYATGIKGFGGLEGTWRDAEDGQLSGHPIAQGSVDSTFGLRLDLKPGRAGFADLWIVGGETLDEVGEHYHRLVETGVQDAIQAAGSAHRAWLATGLEFQDATIPDAHRNLARQSLLLMRTQIDHAGGVVAATDSDILETNRATYCYVWPRDGAFVSSVFDRSGHPEVAARFFGFCRRILDRQRPVFFQKYGPDGSLGASWHPWIADGKPEMPFQQDETALVVKAITEFVGRHGDPDGLLEGMVFPACDFMADHRDPTTGLPHPSWDLWEERRGIHAFTLAALVAAFRGAARHADTDRRRRYETVVEELTDAIRRRFFDDRAGVFLRSLIPGPRRRLEPDRILDSSVLAVGLLGAISPTEPGWAPTVETVERGLRVGGPIDGIARYQGDYYFRRTERVAGNPWIICSLWLGQARLMLGDMDAADFWLDWTCSQTSTGVLPEQLDPDTGAHLSVSPLTWSHAEFVNTVLHRYRMEGTARESLRLA